MKKKNAADLTGRNERKIDRQIAALKRAMVRLRTAHAALALRVRQGARR